MPLTVTVYDMILIVCLFSQHTAFGWNYTWITLYEWQLVVQEIWSSLLNVQQMILPKTILNRFTYLFVYLPTYLFDTCASTIVIHWQLSIESNKVLGGNLETGSQRNIEHSFVLYRPFWTQHSWQFGYRRVKFEFTQYV